MKWYYASPAGEKIKFEEPEFSGLVQSGRIERSTLVWTDGFPDWKTAGEARPDLFPGAPPDSSPAISTTTSPATSDGLASTAFVCGILSLVGIICIPVNILAAIAAIICARLAKKKNPDDPKAAGQIKAGLICAYTGLGVTVLLLIIGGIIELVQ